MPQPLSRVKPNAGYAMSNIGELPLLERPQLAAFVAEAISSWSKVENFMLRLFVDLMGGHQDRAATVFLALEIQSAKSAAINAIAEATLPTRYKHLLRAILALAKSNQKSRDKLAHWVWGSSPLLPGALLLCDPRHFLSELPAEEKIYVYFERDFREIIEANEKLSGFAFSFRWILSNHPSNRDDRLYDKLCAEPEIREKLNRRA